MEKKVKTTVAPEWIVIESAFSHSHKKAFYKCMQDENCLGYLVSITPEYVSNMLSESNQNQWVFSPNAYKEAKKKYLSLVVCL